MKLHTSSLLYFMPSTLAVPGQEHRALRLDSLRSVWTDSSVPDTSRYEAMETVIVQRRYSAPSDSLLGLSRELVTFTRQRGLQKRLEEMTRPLETLAALGRARIGADGWTYL